mmetsp:Transcript_72304/g.192088  ORF Transcript_72304/g.192088 Transcript_72304/m.192088 type:complete len:201 (-) Transcript_72304:1762-2364(-)
MRRTIVHFSNSCSCVIATRSTHLWSLSLIWAARVPFASQMCSQPAVSSWQATPCTRMSPGFPSRGPSTTSSTSPGVTSRTTAPVSSASSCKARLSRHHKNGFSVRVRYVVPALFLTVTQPMAPSFIARHCIRSTSRFESSCEAPMPSSTSPSSSFRTFLAVLISNTLVRVTSRVTLRMSATAAAKVRHRRPCGAILLYAS